MSLQLILDASIKVLKEPGFWRFVSTRGLSEGGYPANDGSHQGIWCDEPTKTLMLRPMQFDSSWLNTAAQGDSILRLWNPISGAGDIVVNAADTAAQSIFEAPAFGNADNPFIFHVPVGPAGAFPGHPREEVPGSPPSLIGVSTPTTLPLDVVTIPSSLSQGPTLVLAPSTTMPPANALPTPTPIGNTTDGKFLGHSKTRMDPNQPLFFRWFHPSSMLGFPCIYELFIGQFRLRIKDVVVEIYQDISPGGDRTKWKKIARAPLFSVGDLSPTGPGQVVAVVRPQADLAHDRSLLWLPFRRNQVLLYASSGKWFLLTVNGAAKRLTDNSDWDIVRSDVVLIWVQTPAAGRFQLQKVKYPPVTLKLQSPAITLDYTPAIAATVSSIAKDSDHGSSLTAAKTTPPGYTIPANSASDCPPPTTTSSDVRSKYGVELSFTASSDKRWTPFFYGFTLTADRVFVDPPTTPKTINDTNNRVTPASALQHATLTAGLEPGTGRLTAEVLDEFPYPLSNYYYRCSMPVQLVLAGAGIFSGVTCPTEVTPLTENSKTRRLTFSACDRWKHLSDVYLRDQRDWTPTPDDAIYYGHIDVVRFIAEQAGVDCTNAEFPAGYVAHVNSALNSPLGGSQGTIGQQTKDVEQGWRPRKEDTAASFIKRIQELYSAWYCGFRLDGTFFYLPRDYFKTSSVTFHGQHTGGGISPFYLNPVTFTTVEPEANVILVEAGDAVKGTATFSSPWVDWASILNPAAVNYLAGAWRAEIITVGGTFRCAQLNRIARTIWMQTRRRRRHAKFEAEFVPTLKIGQVFTLGAYGDYRLIGMDVKLESSGYHRASYTGELVENGF